MRRSLPEDNWGLDHADPLDRLLLRVPMTEPDAWFAARALARCRYSEPAPTLWSWGRIRTRWALASAFALLLCTFTFQQQLHHSHRVMRHQERNVQEAFEVVASIGTESDSSSAAQPDSSLQ